MSGAKIIKGAEQATAVARGEKPAARVHIAGHAYVPEATAEALADALERAAKIASIVTVGQVFAAGDEFIEAAGLDPWALNEGRASPSDRISTWRFNAPLRAIAKATA